MYAEIDALAALLKPYFENSQRAVICISHSLGSTLSNRFVWKLLTTSTTIATHGIKQCMFAPLLLVDEPYQWMRDVATSLLRPPLQ